MCWRCFEGGLRTAGCNGRRRDCGSEMRLGFRGGHGGARWIGREILQGCWITSSVRRIWRMSSSQHQQTSIVSSHECKRLSDTELKAHPSDFVFAWCSCKRSLPESVSATLYQPRIPPQRDRQNLTAKRSCPVTNQSIDRCSRPRWLCCIMVVGVFNLLQQRPSFPPRPKGLFVPSPSNLGGLFALCWLMALANFASTNTLSGDAVKKSVDSSLSPPRLAERPHLWSADKVQVVACKPRAKQLILVKNAIHRPNPNMPHLTFVTRTRRRCMHNYQ
jgi:hypothetical protein